MEYGTEGLLTCICMNVITCFIIFKLIFVMLLRLLPSTKKENTNFNMYFALKS